MFDFAHMSSDQGLVFLVYTGGSTEVDKDYNKPWKGFLLAKPDFMVHIDAVAPYFLC